MPYDRVVDLYRDEFDREFVRVMIDDHDAAVQLFRGESSGGTDPALRAFAAQTLPLIQSHLQHAKALNVGRASARLPPERGGLKPALH